jgi:hypothetical protein
MQAVGSACLANIYVFSFSKYYQTIFEMSLKVYFKEISNMVQNMYRKTIIINTNVCPAINLLKHIAIEHTHTSHCSFIHRGWERKDKSYLFK